MYSLAVNEPQNKSSPVLTHQASHYRKVFLTMNILTPTAHFYKTDDIYTGARVEGDTLIIANTRNEESAAEGKFVNLVTVIPLIEAIAIAKMVLATQEKAEADAAYDAFIDEQYKRWLDHKALVDDALESEIRF